ncbi:SDR family NAD(P)-dependent oxidoreductase [Aliihoeflea sp. 40Bstr573]|uniref:SDR family NAD(P)-dependent oxidoreductase n=1 Tax=Aliihoeflea sp. 40Bstr573 TaxID=2696467 RepID=UPI002095960E|nr:SDR family NAD(P)-dependent oxidoreductase [Aliihoeflea sp. 40Bstr573]MCO6386815.1 SDR family NAD(P)-dependent oxidoreductase [Aliihoeflea sp. 40Bstr573]
MSLALVIGASGGIGAAIVSHLEASGRYRHVIGLSRSSDPALDLLDESTIATAAKSVAAAGTPGLVIDATGILSDVRMQPEKALRALDPAVMTRSFAINAIGPALLMKHFLPLFPRDRRSAFATLSAKVGSAADNRLGGWYSYRASKAALNQLVRTASIELRRTHPQAICVAIHPGTVATRLSQPFQKSGLEVLTPARAAAELIEGLDRITPGDSGGFFDRHGTPLPF